MKPGRELDALIAEKVMGLEKVRYQEQGYHNDLVYGENGIAEVASLVPCYSTDISAAWEVVEKIHSSTFDWSRSYGYYVEAESITKTSTDLKINMYYDHTGWEVRFMDMQNNTFVCAYKVKTAPLAICEAALRAVSE